MSAYGTIPPPKDASNEPLSQLLYQLPDKSRNLLVVPFRRENVANELADHLHTVRTRSSTLASCTKLSRKLTAV